MSTITRCEVCGGNGVTPWMGDDYDYTDEHTCEVCGGEGDIYVEED